jgi:hypothetical protein
LQLIKGLIGRRAKETYIERSHHPNSVAEKCAGGMMVLVRFAAPNFGNDVSEGAGTLSHTLTLSAPSTDTVRVTVRGPSNRAGDLDYFDKVVEFAPGQISATFTTQVYEDTIYEGNEGFAFEIVAVTGAEIDRSESSAALFYGYIVDNDSPGQPEIAVLGNGVNIADDDTTPNSGDHTDFGKVAQGGVGPARTFTVRNDGNAMLTTSGLVLPAGFSIVEALSASIAPGGSDTFTVRLDTGSAGTKTGQISFATNDSDENPFNFSIIGTVNAPPSATIAEHTLRINQWSTVWS